jgi:hypothetical protein
VPTSPTMSARCPERRKRRPEMLRQDVEAL